MARRKVEGRCRICGSYERLTFEHIPPQAAFNDQTVIMAEGDDALADLAPGEKPRGRYQQGGAGDYTLCGKCNNTTGAWYADAFVAWCYQGMDILARSGGYPRLIYMHYIRPLRVIKQIAAMMFSVNGDGFQDRHPELVKFVLDRESRYLSPNYRFYTYFTTSGLNRAHGVTVSHNINTGRTVAMCEITFPPFGYVLTLKSRPHDPRLYEISHFAQYDYEQTVVTPLQLPVLPVHLAYPGDYRTLEQIDHEYNEALSFERGMRAGVPLMLLEK